MVAKPFDSIIGHWMEVEGLGHSLARAGPNALKHTQS